MMRFSLLAAAVFALPLAAQQPDAKPASRPTLPDGWQARLDRANANAAAIKFATMPPGWHVTAGPSAIYWNPQHMGAGQYEVSSSIILMRPSAHPEAYGVFFGGRNLDTDDQRYNYFLVRQDGKYLIKHRAGSETHTIVDWTAHPAVKVPQGEGEAANDLTVRVGSDSVQFLVNGQQVNAFPRSAIADIDGQAGLRINHNLDVHVARLNVEKF
jgi:hypothetical protein